MKSMVIFYIYNRIKKLTSMNHIKLYPTYSLAKVDHNFLIYDPTLTKLGMMRLFCESVFLEIFVFG